MKLQADIPKEIHKELKIYKIRKEFITLEQALIEVLKKFFEERVENER